MTEIDFGQISAYQRYRQMPSLIVPRPIALVTTLGANGVVNAAPFSMFNMMGEDPPILVLNINRLQDGRLKDTAANILYTTAWRVNLRDYHPVGRFGASHYVKTGDRFAIDGKDNETLSTPFDEI